MRNVVLLLIIVLLVSCSAKRSVAKEEICGIRSEFYYVTDSVAQKIKSYEGLALKSYSDSGKRYAIGYGHTGDVKRNQKITKREAEKLFRRDLSRCMAFINGLGICTTQNEFDALVSLVFNVGENSFLASRLYKEIQRWEEPELIKKEFSTWCYSNGKPSKGLEDLKPLVTPMLSRNASYGWNGGGCPNDRQRKFIAQTYPIYREILHYLTLESGIDNVYTSPTLTCGEGGELIKIERIDV